MAQLNFDASTVAPQEAFDPLPAGWYNVQIVDSEMKPTTKPGGAYLSITLQVIGGEYNNRKVFDRFNLQNSNPVAVEIAYRSLSAVCHAVGMIQVADSQLLHGKPLMAKVSLRAARTDAVTQVSYEASNEVKGYKATEAGGAAVAGAPAGGAPAWATGAPAAAAPAPAIAAVAFAPPAFVTPPVVAAPPPPAAAAFPPAGWTAHPQAPGYFYQGQEVITEAELRVRSAPVVAPAAPVAPAVPVAPVAPAPIAAAPTPVTAPVVAAPVAGATPPWMVQAEAAPAATVAAPVTTAAPAAGSPPPWATAT